MSWNQTAKTITRNLCNQTNISKHLLLCFCSKAMTIEFEFTGQGRPVRPEAGVLRAARIRLEDMGAHAWPVLRPRRGEKKEEKTLSSILTHGFNHENRRQGKGFHRNIRISKKNVGK